MEAAAVLGLAGNVIQFLDFGQKLSKTVFEIWNSAKGITKTNSDTEKLVQAFLESLDSVSEDLVKYHNYLQSDLGQAGQINSDQHIETLVSDCRLQAADLLRRIDRLRSTGHRRTWKTLMAAIKSTWKEREITALESTFSRFRHELETRVLFSLRVSMTLLETKHKNLSETLLELRKQDQFKELQSSISAVIADAIASQIKSLPHWSAVNHPDQSKADSTAVNNSDQSEADSTPDVPVSSHLISILRGQHLEPDKHAMEPLPRELSMAQNYALKLADSEATVLKSLSFSVMHDREEAISAAEASTFYWMFHDSRSTDRTWDNFRDWLESGNSLYWINGKAGSGKSTLMKYLTSHRETRAGLLKWSGETKVLMASFFFWYSGYELQKSQIGLLRGLLYSCLRDRRELIPVVIPETAEVSEADLALYWTMPRLRKAFQKLVSQTKFELKFCFFIDGLDEYAGAYPEMVCFIKETANHDNVKICASSRPLLVFDSAFTCFPRLVLQNLTFDDIQRYIGNKLTNNEMMSSLELSEPGVRTELISNIVTKASGVFLWVRMVVESLLDGLSNYDTGHDLKRRLDDLPPDLEDLYWHMVDRVKPQWYLEEGFSLLRILKVSDGQLPLPQLCLAVLPVKDLYKDTLLSNPSFEEQKILCQRMVGRLKSRCLGLLEVVGDNHSDGDNQTVTFIHKSVYDFLETEKAISRMMSITGQNQFYPEVALMRGTLLQLKLVNSRLKASDPDYDCLARDDFFNLARPKIVKFIQLARLAEDNNQQTDVKLVDELKKTADAVWHTVSFMCDEERAGVCRWIAAPRNPKAAMHAVYGTAEDARLTLETLKLAPQNRSLNIRSFEDLVQVAGLSLYAKAKGLTPLPLSPVTRIEGRAYDVDPAEVIQPRNIADGAGTWPPFRPLSGENRYSSFQGGDGQLTYKQQSTRVSIDTPHDFMPPLEIYGTSTPE